MSQSRVLVVDDDEAVRSVAAEMLRRSEYDVECAASGQAALDLMAGMNFDLVLLDVGMPGMSGVETYERLRADYPTQKVLFMTGYSEEEALDLDNPNTHMLSKPFTLKIFTETIRSVR